MKLMIPTIYKAHLPFDLLCTDPQYLPKLKEYYGSYVVTPRCDGRKYIKLVQKAFSLHRENLSNLDLISYDTLKSSFLSADFLLANDMPVWILPESKQSKIFYDYFHKRFHENVRICILYSVSEDSFLSNCSMFELYLKIYRGISPSEVEQDSMIYRDYLNSLFIYNRFLSETEKTEICRPKFHCQRQSGILARCCERSEQ